MKGEESFLQILTSLSSLFPDKFLSVFFMLFFQREEMPQALCLVCDVSDEMPLCLDCIEMKKCRQPLCVGLYCNRRNAVSRYVLSVLHRKKCRRHQTMVASHTAAPLGGCEMAGKVLPPIIQPAFMVGDMCCVCPLPTGKVPGVVLPYQPYRKT